MYCLSNRLPCMTINCSIFAPQKILLKRSIISIMSSLRQRDNHVCLDAADDDYRKAVSALNSLQSNRRAQNDARMVQHPIDNTSAMLHYLTKCGMELQNLEQKLSVIHVSGTKGKGSTCAYCESILRQYGYKTGFFSSPHLCSVRERIRINGESLSKKKFAEHFGSVYESLKRNEELSSNSKMPPYFMFLTIMAFKVFLEEKVNVVILEVGIGGEYDCTNILKNSAVVGITSLGYDHVRVLGKTIEEIAWQKAGIIKPSSIVVTAANQPKTALPVLQSRAAEKGCTLYVAPDLSEYEYQGEIVLGIGGFVQRMNASLALQLANAWMNPQHYRQEKRKATTFTLTKEMIEGLRTCSWLGRTQVLKYSAQLSYYLDGAHTDESLQYCLQWFEELVTPSCGTTKVLVFNIIGDRDANTLLKLFLPYRFDLVCFCPNRIESSGNEIDSSKDNWSHPNNDDENRAEKNHRSWLELNPEADEHNTRLFSSVNEVHECMLKIAEDKRLQVLVTGSLHLVGTFLSLLGSDDGEKV